MGGVLEITVRGKDYTNSQTWLCRGFQDAGLLSLLCLAQILTTHGSWCSRAPAYNMAGKNQLNAKSIMRCHTGRDTIIHQTYPLQYCSLHIREYTHVLEISLKYLHMCQYSRKIFDIFINILKTSSKYLQCVSRSVFLKTASINIYHLFNSIFNSIHNLYLQGTIHRICLNIEHPPVF